MRHAAIFFALVWGIGVRAQEIMPVRDVHAGMHGVGRTVFSGDRVENFDVEILGVLEQAGPKQSVILARLSGGPLAEAGIIQGMSGSPVYIDGKLIGAVALGFPFSKEPIAGITPIAEMIAGSGGAGVGGSKLAQILTPLSVTGLTPRTIKTFSERFRKFGFDPEEGVPAGGGFSHVGQAKPALEAGEMISVQLLSGDMSMGADGTVTYVHGNRFWAFGHRFLDVGATELPVSRAEVVAVIPTLNSSFKLSNVREPLGTLLSDRASGVSGELGRVATTIPLSIAVKSGATGDHTYRMRVVNDRLLTPFLTQSAVFSAIDATEQTLGPGTMELRGRIEFAGAPPLEIRDNFISDSGLPMQVSADAVAELAFAMSAGFSSLQVKSIAYELRPVQQKRQVYITEAWPSSHTVRPGDSVTVTAQLSGENGLTMLREATYQVPIGAPAGQLNFTISDANTQNFPDFAGMNAASARTPEELVRLLNQYRGANAAYVRVWRFEPSFTISGPKPGGEVSDPPPSVMLILADPTESPVSNTAQVLTRGSAVAEFRLPVDGYVVSGAKTVQVEVKPEDKN